MLDITVLYHRDDPRITHPQYWPGGVRPDRLTQSIGLQSPGTRDRERLTGAIVTTT
jgi:hypothetical protein